MTFWSNLKIINRIKQKGLIDEKTKMVLNHFSHNGDQNYDKICEESKKYAVIIVYGRLRIEFEQ